MAESAAENYERMRKSRLYDGMIRDIRQDATAHPERITRAIGYSSQIVGQMVKNTYQDKYSPWNIRFNLMRQLFTGDAQIELFGPVEGNPDAECHEVYTFRGDRISWIRQINEFAPGGGRECTGNSDYEGGWDLDYSGYQQLQLRLDTALAELG